MFSSLVFSLLRFRGSFFLDSSFFPSFMNSLEITLLFITFSLAVGLTCTSTPLLCVNGSAVMLVMHFFFAFGAPSSEQILSAIGIEPYSQLSSCCVVFIC
jgi:hypothetical protein